VGELKKVVDLEENVAEQHSLPSLIVIQVVVVVVQAVVI
jgi:hypothetical protein